MAAVISCTLMGHFLENQKKNTSRRFEANGHHDHDQTCLKKRNNESGSTQTFSSSFQRDGSTHLLPYRQSRIAQEYTPRVSGPARSQIDPTASNTKSLCTHYYVRRPSAAAPLVLTPTAHTYYVPPSSRSTPLLLATARDALRVTSPTTQQQRRRLGNRKSQALDAGHITTALSGKEAPQAGKTRRPKREPTSQSANKSIDQSISPERDLDAFSLPLTCRRPRDASGLRRPQRTPAEEPTPPLPQCRTSSARP